ncbi:hypothetical protein DICPUDRAFT_153408 [Dictyostelium purpureum]|uniref:Uncharacterized protein n=1 Tax=Dictyostelium purpureum TaxID=5786 RepID=F0ZNU1_DICPU|nr:uncharacterized protein DICPUDRAFT_153408 [Dictyostelium purpureum]EGC34412.1 hypothetical protein DICPUDRAFT_153408 [Dictyostelium purpureum]|eukprot:XP_003289086.1 hypothetical protein DICPUDRAFT_153408 [Dictyostelium purpureum]
MQRGFVAGVKFASKCSSNSFRVATAAAPKNSVHNNFKSASCNINSQQSSNIPASFSTTSSSLAPPNRNSNTVRGTSILSSFKHNSFLIISDGNIFNLYFSLNKNPY